MACVCVCVYIYIKIKILLFVNLAQGKSVDATQELIAIGLANVGSSFVQAFPGTGSLSRSAVYHASGVRTPMSGLYAGMLYKDLLINLSTKKILIHAFSSYIGLLVILALLFLTPYFSYIPRASLAAIIISAVVFMVEVKVIKPMWRTKSENQVISQCRNK